MTEIVALLASPDHRWSGRPGPQPPVVDDTVDRVHLRAQLGIVGDRYFNQSAHRDASVTLIDADVLSAYGAGLEQVRRNIAVRGIDVDAHVGQVLELDSGDGPVRLRLTRPARPCGWLDVSLAPGARRALRDHAGARCVPLDDGTLRVGPVRARWLDPQS